VQKYEMKGPSQLHQPNMDELPSSVDKNEKFDQWVYNTERVCTLCIFDIVTHSLKRILFFYG